MSVLEKFKEQVVDKLPTVDSYERHDGLKCVIIDDRGLKDTERAMKSVKAILPDAEICHYKPKINSMQDYNLYLTSLPFWNSLDIAETVLIFQPDSLVLNKEFRALEKVEEHEFDYCGAPWDLSRMIKFGTWVGNGGLSIRNVEESLDVIYRYPYYINNEYHEDTYFAKHLNTVSFEDAIPFSVEWHYYPKPFGIHDIESHLSQKLVENILKNSDLNGIARANK